MAKYDEKMILQSVRQLEVTCLPDLSNTEQVTSLALNLFDKLKKLHGLGNEERLWLECGARLHDIGWSQGWKSHHKNSMKMILASQILAVGNKEKYIIASIARYHRKALPSLDHDHFAILQPGERKVVIKLAALLRIADGLDRTHQNLVKEIEISLKKNEVIFDCICDRSATEEIQAAINKADLFEDVYKRSAVIRCKTQMTQENITTAVVMDAEQGKPVTAPSENPDPENTGSS